MILFMPRFRIVGQSPLLVMNDSQIFDEFIVTAALERPAAKRDEFLQEICFGDARLRARLAVLLRVRCEPEFAPPISCAASGPA